VSSLAKCFGKSKRDEPTEDVGKCRTSPPIIVDGDRPLLSVERGLGELVPMSHELLARGDCINLTEVRSYRVTRRSGCAEVLRPDKRTSHVVWHDSE
jgi:hypothetical protein